MAVPAPRTPASEAIMVPAKAVGAATRDLAPEVTPASPARLDNQVIVAAPLKMVAPAAMEVMGALLAAAEVGEMVETESERHLHRHGRSDRSINVVSRQQYCVGRIWR